MGRLLLVFFTLLGYLMAVLVSGAWIGNIGFVYKVDLGSSIKYDMSGLRLCNSDMKSAYLC